MDRKTEALNYLKQYPKMTNNTVFSRNIKMDFSPLRVNDMGMCDICQKYWEENH